VWWASGGDYNDATYTIFRDSADDDNIKARVVSKVRNYDDETSADVVLDKDKSYYFFLQVQGNPTSDSVDIYAWIDDKMISKWADRIVGALAFTGSYTESMTGLHELYPEIKSDGSYIDCGFIIAFSQWQMPEVQLDGTEFTLAYDPTWEQSSYQTTELSSGSGNVAYRELGQSTGDVSFTAGAGHAVSDTFAAAYNAAVSGGGIVLSSTNESDLDLSTYNTAIDDHVITKKSLTIDSMIVTGSISDTKPVLNKPTFGFEIKRRDFPSFPGSGALEGGVNAIIDGINHIAADVPEKIVDGVHDWMTKITNYISAFLTDLWNWIVQIGEDVHNGVKGMMEKTEDVLTDLVNKFHDSVASQLKVVLDGMADSLEQILLKTSDGMIDSFIDNTLDSLINKVKQEVGY
jgi:hypothetical protein